MTGFAEGRLCYACSSQMCCTILGNDITTSYRPKSRHVGAVLMPGHLSGCRGENKDTSDMQVYGTSKIYLIMASKALNETLEEF